MFSVIEFSCALTRAHDPDIDYQKQGWACDAVIKVSGENTNSLENNALPYNIKCQPTREVIFLAFYKMARP